MPGIPSPDTVPADRFTTDADHPGGREERAKPGGLLFDLSGIDLTGRSADRAHIERWNPHRGRMSFLDAIVWEHPTLHRGVAVRRVREDEFWVEGHFPGKPMLPGVLMIETGAQLACYLYISRKNEHSLVAFLRIESAAFRSSVKPGDDFFVLCDAIKVGRRSFLCDIQGMVEGRVSFDARISGMMIDPVQEAEPPVR